MKQRLILTSSLRAKLKEPQGELIRGKPEEAFRAIRERIPGRKLITVGDVVTSNAIKLGLKPWVAIVDGKAMREPLEGIEELRGAWSRVLRLENQPGTISGEAWSVIGDAIRSGDTLVLVDGEEDLLAIVAVLCAPEGSLVVYGQPGEGLVLIEVNKDKKRVFREIVAQMRPY